MRLNESAEYLFSCSIPFQDVLAIKERSMMIKSRVPMRRVGQPGEIAGASCRLIVPGARQLVQRSVWLKICSYKQKSIRIHVVLTTGLATFLASDAAHYMTGQCIAMDGGFSAMGLWPIDDIIPFPKS